MLALEETGCAETPSLSVSPAERLESDLSRLVAVFCVSALCSDVNRDETEPRCLTDAYNATSAVRNHGIPGIATTHRLGTVQHSDTKVPEAYSAVLTHTAESVILIIATPWIKRNRRNPGVVPLASGD